MAKKKETTGGRSGRTRTIQRQQERKREQRRNQQVTAAIAVAVLAVIALAVVVLTNQPAEAPIDEAAIARYEDLSTTATEDGYPRLGDPDNTVTVTEFSSFSCSACLSFHETVYPSILERVEAGEVNFVFVPLLTGSVPNPEGAARASLCANQQDAFWPYHDALFSWHARYGNQAFSPNRLSSGFTELGLDLDQYNSCLRSDPVNQTLNAGQALAESTDGYRGTPAVLVNGVFVEATESAINEAIDNALALLGPQSSDPDEPAEELTEEPTEAVEETEEPTDEPTEEPTGEPTDEPTEEPTDAPTEEPTEETSDGG